MKLSRTCKMVGLCMHILVWYPPEIIFDCLRSMPIATLSETPRTPHRSPVWANDNMLQISSTMSGLKTCALDTLWPWFLTQLWGQSYKKSKHVCTLSPYLSISLHQSCLKRMCSNCESFWYCCSMVFCRWSLGGILHRQYFRLQRFGVLH